MQLGKRWRAGENPPVFSADLALQSALETEVTAHEAEHPDAHSWTLTWLEGRARLSLDGGTILTWNANHSPIWENMHTDAPDDDDWLQD